MKRQLSDASMAVLFRLERLQVEMDSIAQQVNEIEAAVQALRGSLRASAVLEGLAQLEGNLATVEGQTGAVSLDHIDGGREEAAALAETIKGLARSLKERMERVRTELNAATAGNAGAAAVPAPAAAAATAGANGGGGGGASSSGGGSAGGGLDESGPRISRQAAVDATLLSSPLAALRATSNGGPATAVAAAAAPPPLPPPQPQPFERMDTGGSEASVGSALSLAATLSVGYGTSSSSGGGEAAAMPSETTLYSWGRVDLGASFQELPSPSPPASAAEEEEPPAPLVRATKSRYSRKNFAGLSTTLYHTVAVTTTGEVYGSGVNEDGQVAPDRAADAPTVRSPMLVEALLSQRVLQVACGDNHTACLTASGAVVSFGANEVGQLGHSQGAAATTRVGPRTMVGLGGKLVRQVACGSYFTLALTAEGQVFSAGVGECGGHADGANRFQAERVAVLRFVPVAFLAAGASHAVAVTVTGHAWSWGQNGQGQAGVPGKAVVQEPAPVPGLANVRSAACGGSHSLFLTFGGEVFACGKNHRGQLGLPPTESEGGGGGLKVAPPRRVEQLSGVGVCMLACGDAHSLALTRDGRVLAVGANGGGQLGTGAVAVADRDGSPPQQQWEASEVQGLGDARVFVIAAGGEQSFAIGLGPSVPPGTAPPPPSAAPLARSASSMLLPLDEGTLDLIRKFSVVKPATSFLSTAALLAMVQAASSASSASSSSPSAARSEGATDGDHNHHTQQQREREQRQRATPPPPPSPQLEALERTLVDLFSSASLVNGSFLATMTAPGAGGEPDPRPSQSGLDVLGLESVYVAVMKLGHPGLLQRLMQAFAAGIDALLANVRELAGADALRCLLAYWQCPLNSNTALSKDAFLRLCDAVVRLPAESRDRLFAWAREEYPAHIFATRLLRPLHRHLAYHLSVDFGKGRAVPTLAVIMSCLFAAVSADADADEEVKEEGGGGGGDDDGVTDVIRALHRQRRGPLVPLDQFANEAVSSLPDESLLHDLRNWKARRGENVFTFCGFPFLLTAEAKRRLLHSEAALEQQQAAQRDMMRQIFQGGPVVPYLVLTVERAHLLQSTLAQIGQLDGTALKKQLKVRFVGEEGVDEGGVKKEFFQLLIAQLFDVAYGMFRPTESRRDLWFNRSCTWSGEEYGLVGVLVGLAVYNATLLDLHLPRVVYKKLLDLPVGLADLEEVEPELMHGLEKLLAYDEAAAPGQATVQDVFCLTFEVDWVEFDQVRRHELKPGGKDIEVTAANRREYVRLYAEWVLTRSIEAQWGDFKAGFDRVMGGTSIGLLRPEELELLVCGTPHLNFHDLEAVARYEGGYTAEHPVVRAFWSVVHEMSLEGQRNFLCFVTGCAKAPIGGLGKLALLIQRAGPDSDSLPTSHTCFNTLLLPEYASKEKLRDRLLKAINECQGFGLQ